MPNTGPIYKLITVGDSGVGKTCLISRFCENTFNNDYEPTKGLDIKKKVVHVDGNFIEYQIWDTIGQDKFHANMRDYYKNSVCIIIVYDISNKRSFDNVPGWIKNCEEKAPPNIVKVIVGNKCDLPRNKRVITPEMGYKLANELGFMFFETSCTENMNIDKMFVEIARKVKRHEIPGNNSKGNYVQVNTKVDFNKDVPQVEVDGSFACTLL